MNAVKLSVRDDAGGQVATLFVRGSLLPRYEPRQALALLAALCVSAGTSAGLTLGVKVALLRAHAPPAALERLAQSIDDTAAADDDPSGHETILSADAALEIALPLLFHSYSEVPFDFKNRSPFHLVGVASRVVDRDSAVVGHRPVGHRPVTQVFGESPTRESARRVLLVRTVMELAACGVRRVQPQT